MSVLINSIAAVLTFELKGGKLPVQNSAVGKSAQHYAAQLRGV
jgi:hypothetical protein